MSISSRENCGKSFTLRTQIFSLRSDHASFRRTMRMFIVLRVPQCDRFRHDADTHARLDHPARGLEVADLDRSFTRGRARRRHLMNEWIALEVGSPTKSSSSVSAKSAASRASGWSRAVTSTSRSSRYGSISRCPHHVARDDADIRRAFRQPLTISPLSTSRNSMLTSWCSRRNWLSTAGRNSLIAVVFAQMRT